MNTVNGGFDATLAAIRQERKDDRARKRALDRERKEIHWRNREVDRRKAREEKNRRRQFAGRVKFCDCGFRGFFGRWI